MREEARYFLRTGIARRSPQSPTKFTYCFALLAMLAVAVLSWKRNPDFAAEMRSSFRLYPVELPADERTLGPAIESPDKPSRKRR